MAIGRKRSNGVEMVGYLEARVRGCFEFHM